MKSAAIVRFWRRCEAHFPNTFLASLCTAFLSLVLSRYEFFEGYPLLDSVCLVAFLVSVLMILLLSLSLGFRSHWVFFWTGLLVLFVLGYWMASPQRGHRIQKIETDAPQTKSN